MYNTANLVNKAFVAASSSSRASPEKPKKKAPASTQPPETPADPFEYYDAGNHWCKSCNVTCGSMFDFFTHLHSKSHRKTQDPYNRPWASSSSNNEKNKIHSSAEKMTKPAKGSEFLVPVRGFYCQLCVEFCGDAICAEDHATSQTHNEKYKKQMYEYPLYEQRRNLDRQAGLTLEVSDKKHSELKRKHEEEESKKSKEKDEGKPKRSKKDKEKQQEEEEKSKHKEEEEKAKHSKKEEDEKYKYNKREDEVERAKYSKKEEEERYLYRKREEEERYKHGKEGGERPRYSKEEEEEERYKHSNEEERFKNRREEEEWFKNRREDEDRPRFSRVEERPMFSWRDNEQEEEEERYRYGKWKEPNLKCSKKEEERYRSECEKEKPRNEKEERQSRKEKGGCQRSGSRKQSEPEKPSESPKVFCGPNPALRAKLRKKSEETAKVEPKAPSVFGKFSWKKKHENELAKEAERVAAEFLKEDEAEFEEEDDPDAFSKSLAAAKSIAIKLSGKTVISPTNAWVPFNSGKIRPNLPAPSMVLRKPSGLGPWVYAKPAPLNTFLSIRPPGASEVTPLPVIQNQPKKDPVLAADIISKAFCGEEVDLKKSADVTGKPDPTSTPDEKKASTAESFNQAPTSTPSAVMPEFKTPLPPLTMMTMESDVSAPGVPESEQNVPVMVTPPPFMQRPPSEVINKSEKPKSNLAAAKAQALFDIFYSSSTTASTTFMATKAVVESRAAANDSKNREALETTTSQMEQTQPEFPTLDNSNSIETDTQESETRSVFDPQDTKAVVESKATLNDSKISESLEDTAPQTEQSQPELLALDNSLTVETDTQESKMESGFDPQATKAVVESNDAPNDSKNSEVFEDTAPQKLQTQPELPALDNINTVETDTQESMETKSGSDPQPKEETPKDAPVQLDNPSDSLGISTETLDLPTEVLGLDLFDFNLE